MTFRYQLTAADFLEAINAHYKYQAWRRWTRRLFFAMSATAIVLVAVLYVWKSVRPDQGVANAAQNLLPLAILAAVWIGMSLLLPRRYANRQFRSNPSAQDPVQFSADDGGVAITSPRVEGTRAWSTYVQWIETPLIFSLYSSKVVFQPIPKRDMTEQIEELRALLKRHIAVRS